MSTSRLVPVFALTAASAALIFVATSSVGCSEAPASDPLLAGQLTEMRDAIDSMRASTESVATDVKRQSRRIEDLSRRVAELGGGRAGGRVAQVAARPDAADSAPIAGMAATADAGSTEIATEVAAVLASEKGRAALAQAARGAVADSAARQRDGFVAYSLARFADEAQLSDSQAKDVRSTWDDVMAQARAVMRTAQPKAEMTAEERAESVATIRTAMRDLGTLREERMRSILDDTQFELYKEREKEIDAGLHGAPPAVRSTPPAGAEAGR